MSSLWKREQIEAQVEVRPIRPLFGPREQVAAEPSAADPVPPPTSPADAPDEVVDQYSRLLSRVVGELVRERLRLLKDLRPDLVTLALAAAREIVGYEASADPAVVEHSLSQALQRLHFAARVLVRLHPDDWAHLQAHPEVWKPHGSELELVADETIERGGCYLESDRGGIDNTIGTQLHSLAERLRESAGEHEAAPVGGDYAGVD